MEEINITRIGCCARYFNKYEDEVRFAKENGFNFMQLWYDKNGLGLHKDSGSKVDLIDSFNFPTIIHAVLNISDFEEHIPKIKNIMKKLNHSRLIIHPIYHSQKINEMTIHKLSEVIGFTLECLKEDGIKVYIENNSLKTPIFTSKEELELIFNTHRDLEFLLDIAHIQSYEHLQELVKIKAPQILHIADKHFDVIHEHIPFGEGELDFNYIFNEVLNEFDGDIIIEVVTSDEDIINAKEYLQKYYCMKSNNKRKS